MDQARDQGEQRSSRHCQTKLVSDIVGVHRAFRPITRAEWLKQGRAGLRDTKWGERTPVKDALIREIVDREDRWNVRVVPFQIARNQRALPIVGMDQVGLPVIVDQTPGELRGCVRERREADVVIAPVCPTLIGIGRTVPFVQLAATNDIIAQAICGMAKTEFEGRKSCKGLASADCPEVLKAAQDRGVAWDDDAYVSKIAQGAWESRRYGSKTAHLNEV
jgi:hypothetical protein